MGLARFSNKFWAVLAVFAGFWSFGYILVCIVHGVGFLLSGKRLSGLLLLLLGSPLLLYMSFGNLIYTSRIFNNPTDNNGTDYNILSFSSPTLGMLVDSGYRNIVTGLWLLVLLGLSACVFYYGICMEHEEGPSGKQDLRERISVRNALFTATIFIWYMVTYDPRHINKSDWLEWLG
jgi:hypothetical protein